MQNIASLSQRAALVAGTRSSRLDEVEDIMLHSQSRSSQRWLLAGGTLIIAACGASHRGSDPSACMDGTLVESGSRAFCVFSSSASLVIEGGFECPPGFEHRFEVGKSVVCGDRSLQAEQLPRWVCEETGEDCANLVQDTPEPAQQHGSVGECIYPCTTAADCPAEQFAVPGDLACVDGACVFTGCVDDAQCRAVIDEPTVCRQDAISSAPICIQGCQTRDECVDGYSHPDQAQVDCVDGACEFIGCTTEEECPGLAECLPTVNGIRECVYPCDAPEDCGAAFSAETQDLDRSDPNWTEWFRITGIFRTAAPWTCRDNACQFKAGETCFSDEHCFGKDMGALCRFPD